ncbi:breakpoint cluster region protein-like isoform X1 [Styela clava]
MEKQKEVFVKQWQDKFPGVPAPELNFEDTETLEQDLLKCKEHVKSLEDQLNQAKFLMIFLQTSLAVSKKTYERRKWGYGSSIDSESDSITSPRILSTDENRDSAFDGENHVAKSSVIENKQESNGPQVQMRSKNVSSLVDESKGNRTSKVLENVKMFEHISEEQPSHDPGASIRSLPNRSSSRKRAPYLEVWECKTGTDDKMKDTGSAEIQTSVSNKSGTTDSFTAAAVSMMDPGYMRKPLAKAKSEQDNTTKRSSAPPRDNYVEVWTCSSGDQISLGIIYDDRMDFLESIDAHNLFMVPQKAAIEPDYNLEDIDAKDGYGKEHYTLAGSEVKLRESKEFVNDPVSNRLTWPAAKANAPEHFQNENLGLGDSLPPNMTESGMLSEGVCDLSDLDESSRSSSLSGSPTFERRSVGDTVQDNIPAKSRTFPERVTSNSPFHKLSQARTTNERINALEGGRDSYYGEYFDEYGDWVGSTPDGQSLDSADFSEEEEVDVDAEGEDEHPSPASGIPDSVQALIGGRSVADENPTPIFAYRQPDDNVSIDSLDKEYEPRKEGTDAGVGIPLRDFTTRTDSESSPSHSVPSNNDAVSGMVDYQKVRSIAEAEKLRMRRWVVSSLLDSEETYLEYLNTLLLYMKPLKATIGTSMPVMSSQDFNVLFYRVPELHSLHAEFYEGLTRRLKDWNADTQIGDLFQKLLSKLYFYEDYVNNYKKAQHTAEKCAKENKQFADIIESLKVQSRKKEKKEDSESISLIEILYKPAERVMRNTLVLQDILKHTPHRHPDYHTLRQVLKQAQHFLNRINASASSSRGRKAPSSASLAAARTANRELVKDGYLVEISPEAGSQRKLRHVFLYSDLLLCAKQKHAAGMFHHKESYEAKWYIPLADLSFKPTDDSEGAFDVPETSEDDLRDLSNRAIGLKKEIAREKKRLAGRKGQSATDQEGGQTLTSKLLERTRKKLNEVEAQIVLSAPNLPLRIYHMQGKSYMFLMSSDYERAEWTEAIIKQQESCFKSFSLTSIEVQMLLASCVKLRKVSTFGSMLIKDDEDLLSGYLTVTVHSGEGFLHACNPYCTLEVDSYGHFQTKAKTRLSENTQKPEWEMEFELEVDGAQTLRILTYDRARGSNAAYNDDVLIAKGKVSLVQGSLRNHEWVKETVLMNEIEIKISAKFTPREQSLRRLPSQKSNGVFGVKIGKVTKREHNHFPHIVKMCVQEIESRGMDEVGIYRVSGVASEVKDLKAYFDTNRKDVSLLLSNVDINAVAGCLKLYFRELPEPLFTNAKYSDFVEAVGLADPETKHNTIWRLLADLPPANYHTLIYLRQHLLRVAENDSVNKMTLHNLATVFGPTLLRPAEDPTKTDTKNSDVLMLSALRMDVHYQVGVLLYCLELPKMPELGATTTGSKLVSNSTDNEGRQSPTTVPKSVVGTSSSMRSTRAPDNVYVSTDNDGKIPRQVSFGSKPPIKSRQSVTRSITMDDASLNKGDSVKVARPEKPIKRSTGMPSTPASQLRERYHAYEEVDIVPLSKSPTRTTAPQSLIPSTSQQNSSNNNSVKVDKRKSQFGGKAVAPPRVPPNKPKPAPRKPSVKKQQTVVTDL